MEGKRKIQYCEDGVLCHSYVLDGGKTYNPCGCGSNVYHLEYDGKQSSACATRVVRIFTKLSQSISPKSLTKAYGTDKERLAAMQAFFVSY